MFVFQRDAHVRLNLADIVNIHVAGSCSHETILFSNSCCLLKFRKMRCLPHIFLGNPHNTSRSNVQFLWTFPEPLTFPRTVTEAPEGWRRGGGGEQEGWGEGRGGGGQGEDGRETESHPCLSFLVLQVFLHVSDPTNGFRQLEPVSLLPLDSGEELLTLQPRAACGYSHPAPKTL